MKYEAVIGLEVHSQLSTKTKLFCRCQNAFGKEGNSLTCPVCLGLPGSLPVLNRQAIDFAIRAGLALSCQIHPESIFARKNYFYPDLPKGYQISQYDRPLCTGGKIGIHVNGTKRIIGITRIHLEEDAGKLLHGDNLITREGSLVDLNRAGVPLIEIVGEPQLSSGSEAAEYLKRLRSILRYIEVSDANMEEGNFRCDANVSIRPEGIPTLGTKVEVKNMNSFRHVDRAIDYEIERQKELLQQGKTIHQETRLWNPDRAMTVSMRSKEHAHDYRYFPDPDLLPLCVDSKWIQDIANTLPELPANRQKRFETELQLPAYDAGVLTSDREIADYYENILLEYGNKTAEGAKAISNFVMAEILRIANEKGLSVRQIKLPPHEVAQLLKLKDSGKVSGKQAKELLDEMSSSGKTADEVIREKGVSQINDPERIRIAIRDVIARHSEQKKQYLAGKEKVFGFFVGQIMKETRGQANPTLLNELLKEELHREV